MIELLIRLTIVLAAGIAVSLACRRASAFTRVVGLRATLVAAVLTIVAFFVGARVGVPILAPEPVVMEASTVSDKVVLIDSVVEEPAPATEDRPTLIWLGGVGLSLLVLGGAGRKLRRLHLASEPIRCPEAALEFMSAVGSRRVQMRTADPLKTALTFGFLRHVVLFPTSVSEWAQEHRRAVVLHEAAHVRRFDCAWQWFALAFRAVLWFHPLAWILAWAHREQAELAADEFAIASGVTAPDYAEALLSFARLPSTRGLVRSQGAFTMSHHPLKRRVQAALRPQRGHSSLLTLGLVAMTTSVGLLAGMLQADARPPIAPQETRTIPVAPVTRAGAPVPATAPRVDMKAMPAAVPGRPPKAVRYTVPPMNAKRPSRVEELKKEKVRLLQIKKQLLDERSNPEVRRLEAEVLKLRQEVAALQKRQRVGASAGTTVFRGVPIDVTVAAPAAASVDGLTIREEATAALPAGAPTRAADLAVKAVDVERLAPGAPTSIPPVSATAPAAFPGSAIAPTVTGTQVVPGYGVPATTILPPKAPSKAGSKTTKKPATKPKKKG